MKKQGRGRVTEAARVIPALVAGALALFLSAQQTAGAQQISAVKQPARAEAQAKNPQPFKKIEKSTLAAIETKKLHRLAIQVNGNEPAAMNLALNNASNVVQYYQELGEEVEIEIVAYGPGLHMLREDTSPVKDRIKSMRQSNPNVSFKACGNTRQNMQKAEAREIPLVPEAQSVKSGVVRLMELQEQGWSYIRP